MKKGRFSRWEKQYISDNVEHHTYDVIAESLDRDPESVKKYIEEVLGKDTSLAVGGAPIRNSKNAIQLKPFWTLLQRQYEEFELDMIVYYWDSINEQFDHDILSTEEMQVLDLCKLEVAMQRNQNLQKDHNDKLKSAQEYLSYISEQTFEDDKEKQKQLQERRNEISSYNMGIGALLKSYNDLQTQKNRIFQDLKATRKDRIQRIDAKKESFIKWVEELLLNPEFRKRCGLDMEKMRLAAHIEIERLSDYHDYEDGKTDQPLLNHETVKDDNE